MKNNETLFHSLNKDYLIDISSLQRYFIFTFLSDKAIVFIKNNYLYFIFDHEYTNKEISRISQELRLLEPINIMTSAQEIISFFDDNINKVFSKSKEIVISSEGKFYNNIIYIKYKDGFVKFSNVEDGKILEHVVGNTNFHSNYLEEYDPELYMNSLSIRDPYSLWNRFYAKDKELIKDFYLEKKYNVKLDSRYSK